MDDRWWCIECGELRTKVHGDETKHIMVHVSSKLYAAICAEQKRKDAKIVMEAQKNGLAYAEIATLILLPTAPEEEHDDRG